MNVVTLRAMEKLSLFYYGLDYCTVRENAQVEKLKDVYMDFVLSTGSVHAAQALIDDLCERDCPYE